MKMDCINSIDIYSNNKDVFTITSDSFDNFYIANIDDNGDEMNYLLCDDQITLFANFFMIKIKNEDKNNDSLIILQRLLKKKDIIKPYLYEILLYTIIGFGASLLITKFLYPLIVNNFIYTTPQEIKEYYFFYVGWGSILGWDACIYFIMILSLLIMVFKICKKSPIEIIKDL